MHPKKENLRNNSVELWTDVIPNSVFDIASAAPFNSSNNWVTVLAEITIFMNQLVINITRISYQIENNKYMKTSRILRILKPSLNTKW